LAKTVSTFSNFSDLSSGIPERYHLIPGPSRFENHTLFDTFDWRLYNKDVVLVYRDGELILESIQSGKQIAAQRTRKPVQFIDDLPDGKLRSKLSGIVDIRALQLKTMAEVEITPNKVLDKRRKTIMRLNRVQVNVPYEKEQLRSLTMLQVEPLKGYAKQARKVTSWLKKAGFSVELEKDIYTEIFESAGLQPGRYSSKPSFELNPEMRSIDALRVICLFLLDVMRENEEGIRLDIDSEFLHDFRVAVRRTRSAISQLKGVLPPEVAARFSEEFSFIGSQTNQLRDIDVYLLKESEYKSMIPQELGASINPMFAYLRSHRKAALQQVIDMLDSQRFGEVIADWQAFLVGDEAGDITGTNADKPVIALARERIYKRYRSIINSGNRLLKNMQEERLHDLRIECKKLRYLLEFFQGLFPARQVQKMIRDLRELQVNLGEFNDLAVQTEYLHYLSGDLSREGDVTDQTLLTIGSLIGVLNIRKKTMMQDFSEIFAQFAKNKNQKAVKDIFRPAKVHKD
jgi:CHAD domain-containing protein